VVKRLFYAAAVCFLFATQAWSVTVPEGVSLTVRPAEKRIYTPSTPIQLQVSIRNDSSSAFTFQLAESYLFNLDVEVRTLRNETLEPSSEFIRKRSTNQHVYYREVRLLPGEEYSFRVSLDSFVELEQPGVYFLKATFYPDMQRNASFSSNELTFHVRPDLEEVPEFQGRIDRETEEILKKHDISPDEVVSYTLSARQQGQWNKFFLYLDVRELMLKNPLKRREYRNSSEKKQIEMVEEYRDLLKNNVVDSDIVVKPTSFEILRTSYTSNQAEVIVRERFEYPQYTEVKRYTYYLHRPEQYWIIHDYSVVNERNEE
jgi:hypothetical protein